MARELRVTIPHQHIRALKKNMLEQEQTSDLHKKQITIMLKEKETNTFSPKFQSGW